MKRSIVYLYVLVGMLLLFNHWERKLLRSIVQTQTKTVEAMTQLADTLKVVADSERLNADSIIKVVESEKIVDRLIEQLEDAALDQQRSLTRNAKDVAWLHKNMLGTIVKDEPR